MVRYNALFMLRVPRNVRGGHFQETYGKSPLAPLCQRGGTRLGNRSFPPFDKGGQGGFIFKIKPNGQVSSLPFSTIVLSSTQLDTGFRRYDESKGNEFQLPFLG